MTAITSPCWRQQERPVDQCYVLCLDISGLGLTLITTGNALEDVMFERQIDKKNINCTQLTTQLNAHGRTPFQMHHKVFGSLERMLLTVLGDDIVLYRQL